MVTNKKKYTMRKLLLFACALFGFMACTQNPIEEQSAIRTDAPETIRVGFEDDETRIQLNSAQKTVWTKGDLVSVFYRSDANQKWQYQGETGERVGDLKRVDAGTATESTKRVVVVYPYNENYYINTETYNVQASLPATQHYLANSYGTNGNIMISSSEYNQFSLKSVCGWLKLQLTGDGEVVKSIKFRGNDDEQVAGELYINSTDATAALASDMGNTDDNNAGGSLVFDDTILTEVTLDCGEGVALGNSVTTFYIALPPQTFAKGITVEITATDDSVMTKSTDKSITIERNCIQPMTEFVYEGVKPLFYELTYTTNNGKPLDPYTTDGFGANYIENTYDVSTGCGALKFDGPILQIPQRAFVGCNNLTHIALTETIKRINTEAFNGCSSLKVMNIPQSVTSISDKAFFNCTGMQEITIPKKCSIGISSFEGCGGKAYINCPIPYGYYEKGTFYRAKFTEVVLGDNVTSIGDWGFYSCSELKSITIPSSLRNIEYDAFAGCSITRVDISDLSAWCKIKYDDVTSSPFRGGKGNIYLNGALLKDIVIPESVTEIKSYAFYKTESITSIQIHDKVTMIGDYAFYGCKSLYDVTIGNRVTSIGNAAFAYCDSLTSVTIGNRVISIGTSAFSGCNSLTSVNIIDIVAWCNISFSYSSSNPLCYAGNLYVNGELVTDLIIPDSVTSIGQYTFYNCSSLTSVTIPDSVTSIGGSAFSGCSSLTSVTIPDSVTSIGGSAFSGCSSLTSVYCKATTPPTGGSYMFDSNASGRKIYVPAASVDAYKSAEYWSNYADAIEMYPYIPSECTSLTITADDVRGNDTTTTIYYTAVTYGVDGWGEYKSETITGTAVSDEFPQNPSTTESIERTVSFTYLGQTATTTITQGPFIECSYTISLNNAWRQSTSVSNPDSSLYDGVYESFSNYNVDSGVATMYVDIEGYTEFSIYVRSNAESNYDYVTVSELDSTTQKTSTKGNQNSGTAISNYTKVTYTGIDGGSHRITITYRKDGSVNNGADRGYLIIPKNQ